MKKYLAAIAASAIISAYASKVLQSTNGYHHVIYRNREKWRKRFGTAKKANGVDYIDTDGTWGELADCPWCLAPYVTLPAYLAAIAILKPDCTKSEHLLGYASATSLGAFLRYFQG